MRLQSKVAVITGGGGGLGRAIALALGREGAKVVVNDVATPEAEAAAGLTAEGIRRLGGYSVVVPADVSNEAEVHDMIGAVVERLGTVDILINNAGINRDGLMKNAKKSDWDAVLAVHLTGAFNCVKAVVPIMRERGYGRIVSISSVVGQTGVPGTPYYAAAKAGMMGLTRAVAAECAGKGITVNAVAPGYVEAGMGLLIPGRMKERLLATIPIGRFARPEEVSAAVVFLASDDASYITGAVLPVNGGFYM